MQQELLPGTEVVARGLRWEVVFSEPAGEQTLFRLRCLDGGHRGHEMDFLVPHETLEPVARDFAPDRPARLQHWRVYHQAFLLEQALGPDALLAAQPGRLRIQPYQLVPVMRVLQMPRPRLLLADGVGLGKTIEAGLVLAELIARRRAHRILIVAPAGPLLLQWQAEMRERFGLRFTILDRDRLQDIRQQQELGANAFDYEALGLISIQFARQDTILEDLERSTFDVVVIDEAHHCLRLGGAGDKASSQQRKLAEVLARKSDCLLLLTATPHDGYDAHFASLVELLDRSLVDGRGVLRGDSYRRHVVRRLRRHLKDAVTGQELFPERQVSPAEVRIARDQHPAYAAFQEAILALVTPRIRTALRTRQYSDVLSFITLLKRSVSTVAACKATLATIDETLRDREVRGTEETEARRQRKQTLQEARQRLQRFGVGSFEEEEDQAALEAEDMAEELMRGGVEDLTDKLRQLSRDERRERARAKGLSATRQALATLSELAADALPEDPKLPALAALVAKIRSEEPRANILIYTEFTDSQDAVLEHLTRAASAGRLDGDIVSISGRDPDDRRIDVARRFTEEDGLVLVSTDATAEGLNLHVRCHHLIHLELPYNPNRLEQRNGRIDRFGQKKEPQVHYLYLAGTFEQRLLSRLAGKIEAQRKKITFVPNTLGALAQSEEKTIVRLLEGLAEEQGQLFRDEPAGASGATDETTSPAYQDLLAEVDRALAGFERAGRTYDWMGEVAGGDQRNAEDAAHASREGTRLAASDLLAFVADAIRSETGNAKAAQREADGTWGLTIPPSWIGSRSQDLEELPGFDRASGKLHVTEEIERQRDDAGHPVGYLGRAHGLVRRAIDRVRHLQLGAHGEAEDRRVAVAHSGDAEPHLVATYLGRLSSRLGPELERIVGIQLSAAGEPEVLEEPARWLSLATPARTAPTKDAWSKHFEAWAPTRLPAALALAGVWFGKLAAPFTAQHATRRAEEERELQRWIWERARDLCGEEAAVQQRLFEVEPVVLSAEAASAVPASHPGGPAAGGLLRWQMAGDPQSRLAAFATDASNPASARREAEGALKLFNDRLARLAHRRELAAPRVLELGLLLLVP